MPLTVMLRRQEDLPTEFVRDTLAGVRGVTGRDDSPEKAGSRG